MDGIAKLALRTHGANFQAQENQNLNFYEKYGSAAMSLKTLHLHKM